ncbi:MAG: metallophosphoesterase [Parafilimonas sp.]
MAERAMYWEKQKAIVISDAHFGKTGHFRKEGIAVPQAVFREDMQRLVTLIQFYNAEQLIIVGDLFHSSANKEHNFFLKWRNDFPSLTILLIKGNHDILKDEWYTEAGIKLFNRELTIGNFIFTHDIAVISQQSAVNSQLPIASCALSTVNCQLPTASERSPADNYFFTGHLHPGILLKSTSRQFLRFPCFYFGEHYAILPAFANFTGLALVAPNSKDAVFAIVNKEIMRI